MAEKNESHIDRVWEVIAKADICMMVTRFARGLRARPLEARPERDTETIWFLTDVRGLKDDEIEANPNVCLTFVYAKEKVYLSITGKAFVSRDPERAKALWNEERQGWWPGGPEDPNLLGMKIEAERAAPGGGGGGTGRQAGRWPRSNSPGRGLPAPSPISARSAKSLSKSTDSRLPAL